MKVSVIIAAAGRGERLGGPVAKQWLRLGDAPIVEHTIRAFAGVSRVHEVLLVVPDEGAAEARALTARPLGVAVRLVAGGARRQDSVARGFAAVSSDADVVLVHDAARPFVTRALIERTIDAAAGAGAAIAALAVHDTVKETRAVGDARYVHRTLAREAIALAQTPQAFRREVLAAAVALGERGGAATDEAGLAEQAGYRVAVVEGDPRNVKITTAADLAPAQAVLAPTVPRLRVGTGYDLHQLGPGRPLVLGGVAIPSDRGPIAHSDGDAVCHAVTDAVLGAASLGDIGALFPDTDDRWKGASSVALLEAAVARLHAAGWCVVNVDVTVIAERPRIGPHAAAMREVLARALRLSPAEVGVKGKTNEQVDAVGRGEAIAVHAVALVAGSGPPPRETPPRETPP